MGFFSSLFRSRDAPGKIVFADSYDKYSKGITILAMDAYRKSDLIRGIEIYFSNFEEPITLSLDEVLKIVASYMPFEIMDTYYQYKDSELLVPDEGKDGDNYYIISYNLTDEGSAATKELMKLVLEERVAHGGHPVLRWMMDNIYIRTDPAGNIKPDKEKSTVVWRNPCFSHTS